MPGENTSKSKIIGQLREAQRGRVAPIGFGRAADKSITRNFLVLVEPATDDPDVVKAAVAAGADSILVPASIMTGALRSADSAKRAIETVVKAAGEATVGVYYGPDATVVPDTIAGLVDGGCDFVVVSAQRAPTEILKHGQLGRIVRVEPDIEPALLRALGELSIDAIASEPLVETHDTETLTLLDLMHYRALADFARHPALVVAGRSIGPGSLQDLRDAGVLGLILLSEHLGESTDAMARIVAEFQAAAVKVERPTPRRLGDTPLLPGVASSRPFGDDEPEEPAEEPDEDDE